MRSNEAATVMAFEPVMLEPEPGRLTEYGKRWMNQRLTDLDRSWSVLRDILELKKREVPRGLRIARELDLGPDPTNLTGMAQYAMAKVGDHLVAHASFTMPATIGLSLLTVAPTVTSTGASVNANVAGYTGYAILTPTIGTWTTAATLASPSVVVNAGAITWGACTASTSTLNGFCVGDSATLGTSNLLWVASLTGVTISTTQTPPTIASGAMSLSIAGS